MYFEKVSVEVEKYESLDIIAVSLEDNNQTTTAPTTKHDPYEDDKW